MGINETYFNTLVPQSLTTVSYASVAAFNITAASILGGNIQTSGTASGAATMTTPTAAIICAAIAGCVNGMTRVLRIGNTSGQTITLTAGTNVTVTGTATIATAKSRDYLVTIVDASGGSAGSVTFTNIGSAVMD